MGAKWVQTGGPFQRLQHDHDDFDGSLDVLSISMSQYFKRPWSPADGTTYRFIESSTQFLFQQLSVELPAILLSQAG